MVAHRRALNNGARTLRLLSYMLYHSPTGSMEERETRGERRERKRQRRRRMRVIGRSVRLLLNIVRRRADKAKKE